MKNNNKHIKPKQQSCTQIVKNLLKNKRQIFILQETAKSIDKLLSEI